MGTLDSRGRNSMSQAKQMPMVRWYDPLQLIRTGMEVAASTLFGRHSDFRLLEALAAPGVQFDDDWGNLRADESLWIDYVADVGDGWNSTYRSEERRVGKEGRYWRSRYDA